MPARRIVPAVLTVCAFAAPAWAQDPASPPAEFLWGLFTTLAAIAGFILFAGWRFGRATGLFTGICYIFVLLNFTRNYPAQPLNLEGMAMATAMYVVALSLLRKEPFSRTLKVGIMVLAVGGSWYSVRTAGLYRVQSSTQQILDNDGISPIRIIGVDAPKLAFLPLIGPAEWKSFILVGDKDGEGLVRLDCPSVAQYHYKAAGSKFLVQLKTKELRACEVAMGKVKK